MATDDDHESAQGGRMFGKVRHRLTYANVMSSMAVFIALGGSSYAAVTISGSNIKNRSITGSKLKKNALTGAEIKEATLARVTRARIADNAARLEGFGALDFKIRCPADTYPIASVCVEPTPRPPVSYGSAVLTCADVGRPTGPGRRLPTHGELRAALTAFDPAPGGELTSDVYPSAARPGELDVLYVTDKVGSISLTPNTGAGSKAYRCVATPLN
jgi:hypothetical protein